MYSNREYLFFNSLGITLLWLAMLVSCRQRDVQPKEFPSIRTLVVENISANGATFVAEILRQGNQPIVEYGFVWSLYKLPTYENAEKQVKAGHVTGKGFSINIKTSLVKDLVYHVRAYAKTQDYIVYGVDVSFKSLGSGSPKIIGFNPATGSWGDTISISGANFSYLGQSNLVSFGINKSRVILSTDTLLQVIVPDMLGSDDFISVSVAGNQSSSDNKFKLLPILTTDVEGISGKSYDTLNLDVKNLGSNMSHISVTFNDEKANLISYDGNKLKVVVPLAIMNPVQINVKWNNIDSDPIDKFLYRSPEINSISPERGTIYDTLTISGKNFQARNNLDTLFINNIETTIIEVNEDTIKTLVPAFVDVSYANIKVLSSGFILYPNKSFKIEPIEVTSIIPELASFSDVISIKGHWFHPVIGYNKVYLNGQEATILSADSSLITVSIPDDMTFDILGWVDVVVESLGYSVEKEREFRLKIPEVYSVTPSEVVNEDEIITLSGKNFLAFENTEIRIAEYACQIISRTANELSFRLPIAYYSQGDYNLTRKDSLTLIVNNIVELKLPVEITSRIKYHPWTLLESFPGEGRRYGYAFEANGKLYAGGGENDMQRFGDLWEYDPGVNKWIARTDFPGAARSQTYSLGINNQGFVGGGFIEEGNSTNELYKYNPIEDSWTQLPDLPKEGRRSQIHFEYDQSFHVAIGFNSGNNSMLQKDEHYEYNTITNVWEQKNSLYTDPYLIDNFIIDGSSYRSFGFQIENKVFLSFDIAYKRINNGGVSDKRSIYYNYDPVADTTIRVSEFLSNYHNAQILRPTRAINGRAYIGMVPLYSPIELFTFDPDTYAMDFIQRAPLKAVGGFSIVINEKIYFGFGKEYVQYSDDIDSKELWEFDPSKL